MPLTTGSKLGPYEIVAAIGAGGMGEVYRARDTTLNRDVAIRCCRRRSLTIPIACSGSGAKRRSWPR